MLRRDPREWTSLWDLVDSDKNDSFFRFPAQFDLLRQLLEEKALTASERRLRFLSAGCGPGYEPYSLAMCLADMGLVNKGWDITVDGFETSDGLLAKARAANFTQEDVSWLSSEAIRHWFTVRAAGWHYKVDQGPKVQFYNANIADIDSEVLVSHRESYDVIFCRTLSFDCPDRQIKRLALEMITLLTPGGLLFTAPGEIWPDQAEVNIEERSGVVYLRKMPLMSNPKVTVFQRPERPVKRKASNVHDEPPTGCSPDPRAESLKLRFEEVIFTDPDEARELVLEMLNFELDQAWLYHQTIQLMARVEEVLGRRECLKSLENFIARYKGD
jgi:chemotaxis methyl-accepting protein methylase